MYQADEKRYETMQYNRCGNSGLLLPELSLGLWHNFGTHCDYKNMKALCFTAFDCKLCSNGMPVPLLRNGYSIFNGTKYR